MDRRNCDELSSKPLEWDDDFSVNAKAMDKQHVHLFEIINRLRSACIDGLPKTDVQKIINELYRYSFSHFSDEEAILKKKNYPRLEEQQTQHAIFLDYIIKLESRVKSGMENVDADVLTFLNVWWEEHILKIDKQYADIF